jgi:hypothetical protein
MIVEQRTTDWVHTFAVGDVDNDGQPEIIVGLLNDSLFVYKVVTT